MTRTFRIIVTTAGLIALLASMSAASASRSQLQLQAEATTISSGAFYDQLIQSNPERFRVRPNSVPPPIPPLGTNFDTITFDEDAGLNGFYHIPPDPSGAVGTTHVVNTVNTSIEWYTKAGVVSNAGQSLSSFFATAPTPPTTNTFDPKVIYDQYSNRFVVLTMERTETDAGPPAVVNGSRVYLAVSDDADPNGTWYFQTLTTEETIGGSASWADFPGLAVDSEAVYFTTNMFGHDDQPMAGTFTGERVWILAKSAWYAGGAPVATRYDPFALANAGTGDTGLVATTLQPTQMYGDAVGGVGNYLMAYSGVNNGVSLFLQMIRIDSPLSSPTFTGYFSVWGTDAANDDINLGLPSAPQSGTARVIATNDRRLSQNATLRSGFLYFAAPILPPSGTDAGQTTVHWFKVDPAVIATTASNPAPTDQGNIGGEGIAATTHTFFPSVAVDSLGGMAVGFAASAASIFPGSYYAVRLAGDLAGTTRPVSALRAGTDYYIRDFTASTTVSSRWGDYSGMWLDPSNETIFCAFNEHAMTRGTNLGGTLAEEDGRWATAWGCFTLAMTAADVVSFSAKRGQAANVIVWRTATETKIAGFNVWRGTKKANARLIAAKRSGQAGGASYRYVDRTGPSAHYRLQIVWRSGARTWFQG